MRKALYQDFTRKVRNRVLSMVGLLVFVTGYGTLGFFYIEGITLWEAFYMTVISITTVGYGEIIPLSHTGRLFAVSTIFLGVSSSGIALGILSNLVFEETLIKYFWGKRMEKAIENLSDHYVVCGSGTTGSSITEELLMLGEKVVVIELDEQRAHPADNKDCFFLHGDARKDDVLEAANISKAKGLATTLSEDADNVFVVLTARDMNPNLKIVSRFKDQDTEKKLMTAGANHAISPYRMGGQRLALALANPVLLEVIDKPFRQRGMRIQFAQVKVPEQSPIIGRQLKNSQIREQSMGALIVGLVEHNGETVFNPDPEYRLDRVSQLMVLGDDAQIQSLRLFVHDSGE